MCIKRKIESASEHPTQCRGARVVLELTHFRKLLQVFLGLHTHDEQYVHVCEKRPQSSGKQQPVMYVLLAQLTLVARCDEKAVSRRCAVGDSCGRRLLRAGPSCGSNCRPRGAASQVTTDSNNKKAAKNTKKKKVTTPQNQAKKHQVTRVGNSIHQIPPIPSRPPRLCPKNPRGVENAKTPRGRNNAITKLKRQRSVPTFCELRAV